jgi:site-specific DNA-methyltransferase (cytosine-N4-specific)
MHRLLEKGYRHKLRPSGHNISSKFRSNNLGAIPPNLIAAANNDSNSVYRKYCQKHGLVEHPAQFPRAIPAFFIRMLTEPKDLVFDPFAGSCVTGEVAEAMGRRWICCELRNDYALAAQGRFDREATSAAELRSEPYEIYPPILNTVDELKYPLPPDGGESRPKEV